MPKWPWLWQRSWQHFEATILFRVSSCLHYCYFDFRASVARQHLQRLFLENVSRHVALRVSRAIPALIAQTQSMWHLTGMPDEGRTPPRAAAAPLPFKTHTEGFLPWKATPRPAPPRLLASCLSPHLRTLVCPRLLISVTLSLPGRVARGARLCRMLLILLLTAHSRLAFLTQLIMLQVYCAQQRNGQSCFI